MAFNEDRHYLERCLSIFSRNLKRPSLFSQFVSATFDFTGFEAVAIRILDEHGGLPYKAHKGFSSSFIARETHLSNKQCVGIVDSVVRGRFKPGQQCYSANGSFYTDNPNRCLSNLENIKEDPLIKTCIKYEYESFSLVPIRIGNRIIGLIQVADHKPGMLSLSNLQSLEAAALALGIAIRRLRAEERLAEAEDIYHSLIQLGNDAREAVVVLKDVDGKEGMHILFNDEWPHITGYSREELTNLSFFKILLPQDREFSQQRHRRKMAGESVPGLFEMGIRKKDGSVRSIELTGASTTLKKERANVLYIRDVTDRIESEKRLKESETHYHSLFENMLNGIIYCQMIYAEGRPQDFICLSVNQAFLEMIESTDIVGRKISTVIPNIVESNPEIFEIFGRVALSGQPERFESYWKSLDLWLDISLYSNEKNYVTAVFDNITVRKQVTRQLEHSENQLRKLSHRLIAVQEEERSRIARDIHDQLIQELALIKIITASITPKIKRDQIAIKAQQLRELADRLIKTTHRISVNLRPEMLDKLGLTKAIQWYAEEFEGNSGISCPVDCREDQPDIYIPKDISITAYRIIQEATTNIMRHSKATQANIFMHVRKKTLSIKVTDNGIGFNYAKLADESSLGLIGMRERVRAVGGNITIRSKSQYGTSVSVRFTLC